MGRTGKEQGRDARREQKKKCVHFKGSRSKRGDGKAEKERRTAER